MLLAEAITVESKAKFLIVSISPSRLGPLAQTIALPLTGKRGTRYVLGCLYNVLKVLTIILYSSTV